MNTLCMQELHNHGNKEHICKVATKKQKNLKKNMWHY